MPKCLLMTLLCATGLTAPATAQDVSDALEFVPANSAVVITTGNMRQTHARLSAWARKLSLNDAQQGLGMAQVLLANQGLNAEGPAAIVIPSVEALQGGMTGPQMVMVLPVANFEQFVFGLGGEAVEGTNRIVAPFGTIFARSLGNGFAAVSTLEAMIGTLDHNGGQAKAHGELHGKTGARMATGSDLLVTANIQTLAPSLREMADGMIDQMGMMAAMGGMGGEQMEGFEALIQQVSTGYLRDGRTGVLGLHLGEDGVSLDLGANFTEGSEVAGFFQNKGRPSAHLQKLPSMPFLFAMAMDYSSDGIRTLFSNISELTANEGGGMGGADFLQVFQDSQGQAQLIGTTPGLFTGGLFANAVTYTAASDPKALSDSIRAMYADMDGEIVNGIEFETSFEPGTSKINGVDIDSYAIQMRVDPNSPDAMMAQMALQQQMMLMGGSGPQGYLARTEHGVIQTLSRNSELMGKTLKLDTNLGSHAGIAKVSPRLPEDRIMEGYLDVSEVVKMVGSFAGMMGFEVPEMAGGMAPVGMGLSGSDGGMQLRIFVPGEVITSVQKAAEQMQNDFGGPAGNDAGRPRF